MISHKEKTAILLHQDMCAIAIANELLETIVKFTSYELHQFSEHIQA